MNANPRLEPSIEDIQREAYLVYIESGCVPGRDLENWLEARERLSKRRQEGSEKRRLAAGAPLHFPPSAWVQRGISVPVRPSLGDS